MSRVNWILDAREATDNRSRDELGGGLVLLVEPMLVIAAREEMEDVTVPVILLWEEVPRPEEHTRVRRTDSERYNDVRRWIEISFYSINLLLQLFHS